MSELWGVMCACMRVSVCIFRCLCICLPVCVSQCGWVCIQCQMEKMWRTNFSGESNPWLQNYPYACQFHRKAGSHSVPMLPLCTHVGIWWTASLPWYTGFTSKPKLYSLPLPNSFCDETHLPDLYGKIHIPTSTSVSSNRWSSSSIFSKYILIIPKDSQQRFGKVTIKTHRLPGSTGIESSGPSPASLITQAKWEKENKIEGKFSEHKLLRSLRLLGYKWIQTEERHWEPCWQFYFPRQDVVLGRKKLKTE